MVCYAGELLQQFFFGMRYSDFFNVDDITQITGIIETKASYYVKDKLTIKDAVIPDVSEYTETPTLNVAAGNEIHILPEFHAERGSEMHLKIDPNLQNAKD